MRCPTSYASATANGCSIARLGVSKCMFRRGGGLNILVSLAASFLTSKSKTPLMGGLLNVLPWCFTGAGFLTMQRTCSGGSILSLSWGLKRDSNNVLLIRLSCAISWGRLAPGILDRTDVCNNSNLQH